LADLCGAVCAGGLRRLGHLPLARMVLGDGLYYARGVRVADILLPLPAILVQRLPAQPGVIGMADESCRLLAVCVLAPGVFCRLARSQPQRTTPVMSARPLVLGHERQREVGRLHLLPGRAGQRVLASLERAPFHTMVPAPGCAVWLTSQTVLGTDFLTSRQNFQGGSLGVVGHQQAAEDAAIQHLVPTHRRMAEADGETVPPGSQSHAEGQNSSDSQNL
jgi:hypothetical protein